MQVHADFEHVGAACGLRTLCLYGGAQYGPQEYALRKGVDVVVGTPGRVKDHLERGTLNLTNLKYVPLRHSLSVGKDSSFSHGLVTFAQAACCLLSL